MQDRHRSGVGEAARVLCGNPNGQVGEAVTVEVADRQRSAEPITFLREVGDLWAVLGKQLRVGASQAAA